ncbi:MAG: ABC transporter permease [Deltaproteobacteria bacterium]|nr:ABC transporter permease [Deltaproteobacteria bacterium]
MESTEQDIIPEDWGSETETGEPGGIFSRIYHNIWNHPLAVVGLVIILILILTAVLAPVIAPFDPYHQVAEDRLKPPGTTYFFGTDDMGRDIFSRVIWGSRLSLAAAAVVIALSTNIGIFIGAISGYLGGRVDEILMRITDMFLAFPAMVLAMVIASALGPSLINAMIAISVVWWPWYARLIRGQILSIKTMEYIEAAKALGASNARILWKYTLPNCTAPLIVQATLDSGYAILTTASLSFIGVGALAPTPEWGSMISIGRSYILMQWWYPTFPGLAIFLAVAGFNLLGDGLRDILDPRLNV